jgi:hypothetical protein
LAEIAIALAEALSRRRESGEPGRTIHRTIARGRGWKPARSRWFCRPKVLIGAHFCLQARVLDPGVATPIKIVLSNAIDVTIGGSE